MRKKNHNYTYIYVGTLKGNEAYHYKFVCPKCNNEFILATGGGRFGNLGPFMCPECREVYSATIDDHRYPKLYIEASSDHPLADSLPKPLMTLKEMHDKC